MPGILFPAELGKKLFSFNLSKRFQYLKMI